MALSSSVACCIAATLMVYREIRDYTLCQSMCDTSLTCNYWAYDPSEQLCYECQSVNEDKAGLCGQRDLSISSIHHDGYCKGTQTSLCVICPSSLALVENKTIGIHMGANIAFLFFRNDCDNLDDLAPGDFSDYKFQVYPPPGQNVWTLDGGYNHLNVHMTLRRSNVKIMRVVLTGSESGIGITHGASTQLDIVDVHSTERCALRFYPESPSRPLTLTGAVVITNVSASFAAAAVGDTSGEITFNGCEQNTTIVVMEPDHASISIKAVLPCSVFSVTKSLGYISTPYEQEFISGDSIFDEDMTRAHTRQTVTLWVIAIASLYILVSNVPHMVSYFAKTSKLLSSIIRDRKLIDNIVSSDENNTSFEDATTKKGGTTSLKLTSEETDVVL